MQHWEILKEFFLSNPWIVGYFFFLSFGYVYVLARKKLEARASAHELTKAHTYVFLPFFFRLDVEEFR